MKSNEKDFWKGFADELRREGEVRPKGEGWQTLDELVTVIGIHRTNCGSLLMRGVKAGKLERFIGKVYRNGRLKTASWYRPKR